MDPRVPRRRERAGNLILLLISTRAGSRPAREPARSVSKMSTPVDGHLLFYGEDPEGPAEATGSEGRTAGGDCGARPIWLQVSGGPGNTAAMPPGNVQPTRAGTE